MGEIVNVIIIVYLQAYVLVVLFEGPTKAPKMRMILYITISMPEIFLLLSWIYKHEVFEKRYPNIAGLFST